MISWGSKGSKIAYRTKGDMTTPFCGLLSDRGGWHKDKHLLPITYNSVCHTIRRTTHSPRPPAATGNRSSQCESRDSFPPGTSRHLFKLTPLLSLILPPSLNMRGTRPRKERRRSKRQKQTTSQLEELKLQVWQTLREGKKQCGNWTWRWSCGLDWTLSKLYW